MDLASGLEQRFDDRVADEEAFGRNGHAPGRNAQRAGRNPPGGLAPQPLGAFRTEALPQLPEADSPGRAQPCEQVFVEAVVLGELLRFGLLTVDVAGDGGDVPMTLPPVEGVGSGPDAEVLFAVPVGGIVAGGGCRAGEGRGPARVGTGPGAAAGGGGGGR